ncbi:MAG: T9SS type B sorting domain-containing protein [Capnocytophaga sp.]|nr:T9SS type B sorting domain-containing protein [Capnocytophaga sp.]
MKLITSFLLSFSALFFAQAQVTPTVKISDHNGNTTNINIDCDYSFQPNRSITLTANYPTIQQTQNYTVESITYAPVASFSAGTIVNVEGNAGKRDDVFSGTLPLPFEFCFYGTPFNEITVSDNGIVSFGDGNSNGNAPHTIAGTNPNTGLPKNAIFGVYHDLQNPNPSKVRTLVQGTAPFRQFIINYDTVAQFGSLLTSTTQIVLYETTGIIEVYVKDKPENDAGNLSDLQKRALIGVINATGTQGVSPPTRNTDIWSATNEAWRFVPSGTTTINVQWYNADTGTLLGTGDSITQAPTINTRYEVRVTYDLCSPVTVSNTVQVSFSTDFPTANNINQVYCIDSGATQSVDLTAFQTAINSDTTLTFSYHNSETDAHNNQSPIANPNNYALTNDTVIYVRTLRSGICYTVSRINLQRNIRPNIATPTTTYDFCDNGNNLQEIINLNGINIPGVNSSHSMAFFESMANANANTNAIIATSNYLLKVTAPNTERILYVRLWNRSFNDDSCATIIPIRLRLQPFVEVVEHEALICYVVEGQSITHDLTQYVTNLVSGTLTYNPSDITATFYRNSIYTNQIANPTSATITMNATIYVKIEYPNFCESRTILKLTPDTDCDGAGDDTGGGGGGSGGAGGAPGLCDVTFPLNVNLVNDYLPYYLPTGLTVASITIIGFYDDAGMTSTITTPTSYELREDNTPKEVYVAYRVNANGLETSLNFKVNASERKTLNPDTFVICDILNDGTEEVELVPEYKTMLEDLYQFSDPVVRFFLTEVNRDLYIASSPRNETLATEVATISGTNTNTVYALVTVEGCNYKYDLNFLLEPIAVPIVPLVVCDFNNDQQEIINLIRYTVDINNVLTPDQQSSTTSVTYYYSESDAHTTNNPITDATQTLINTGQMSVFARIEFKEGCPVIVHLQFSFTTAVDLPIVSDLNICDILNDGTEIADLNTAISSASASSTISFFNSETAADANDPNFLIGVYSPTQNINITLTTASTTVYVRVLDLHTNCIKVLPLVINLIRFPEITNNQVAVCDFTNDAQEVVSITEIKNQLIANNPTTLDSSMEFALYLSQTDALSGTTSLTTVTATQGLTAWMRITPVGTTCFYIKDIVFDLVASPEVQNLNKIICNNSSRNPAGNTSETVNLNAYREEIIGRPLTLDDNFLFFTSESDALNNTGAIGTSFTISNFPAIVYVRTENNTTQCYSVSSITFDEHPQLAVIDTSIAFCADGVLNGVIDLTTYPAQMVSDTTIYDISYHESHSDAVNDVPITSDITNYYVIPTSEVWIKFSSRSTGCYTIKRLAVSIYPSPKVNAVFRSGCDTDLSGTFTQDLTQYITEIITGEPNVGLLYTFTYHPTLTDAQNGTNAIATPTNYEYSYTDFEPHPSNPNMVRHTVFARVVANTGISCASEAPIYFDAFLKPTIQARTVTLTTCDDSSNDGLQTFDLAQAQNMISTQTGIGYTFYRTYTDMQNQTNAITNLTTYVNNNPYTDTVFVRLSANNFCDDWASVSLIVYPYIQATDRVVNTICKFDNMGNSVTINLLQEANSMLQTQHTAQSSITTTFHNSQTDALSGTSPITSNLTNYDFPIGQKIIWVRFTNTEGCTEVRSLTLEKVSNPTATNVSLTFCDDNADGIYPLDLNTLDSQVTTLTGITVTYYQNENDARAGVGILNKTAVYNIPPHQQSYLYARVENANGCINIAEITLLTIPHLRASVSVTESCDNNTANSNVKVTFESNLNFANVRYAANNTDINQSVAFDSFENNVGYINTSHLPENTAISLTIFYQTCQYTLGETFTITHLQPLSVVEIPQQDPALIVVEASGGRAPYQYTFNGRVSDSPNYVVKYSDPGYVDSQGRTIKQISVVVRDALGCEVTLDIEKVFVDFYVPNFFTPDNDGNNDRWSPRNTKSYPRMITQIYDRNGRLLKTLREGESWDGTYNGTALPSGDYWYSIQTNEPLDGRKFVGNFTLMR